MSRQGVLALPLSFAPQNGVSFLIENTNKMSLPRPPISHSTAIPNQPFTSPEVYYLEGNQGHLPLGQGLYIDPATGEFTNINPSPYIYCTPQFSELPVTYPPYGCETEVNTTGVTDFTEAWYGCYELTEFPCINTSSGTNFTYSWAYTSLTSFPSLNLSNGSIFKGAWGGCYFLVEFPTLNLSNGEDFSSAWFECYDLESFPLVDTSKGTNFEYAWSDCVSLTSFPPLNVSQGTNFHSAWQNCSSLTSFPPIDVSSGTNFITAWYYCVNLLSFPPLDFSSGTNFENAWVGCYNLTSFPEGMFDSCSATNFSQAWQNCALSQQSVDNILVSLDTAGQSDGIVNIDGGTSSAPGASGLAAKASLEGKGWTVTTN